LFLAALAAGAALMAAGAVPPVAGASAVPASGAGPARRLPDFGNPDGHAPVPPAGAAVSTSAPNQVIGAGTPASCTSAAVVAAVASGGIITFNCGPNPVTITMTATAKVVNTSKLVVLDGGGLVTLSGGGERQILYMDTCDPKQQIIASDCYDQRYPRLVVQNMTFEDGNSQVRQSKTVQFGGGGGGAIFALGGQFAAVNSKFIGNRCYQYGPDLGGAAIRALAQWNNLPVYITDDTFEDGQCSNGGALSSIGVSWVIINSVFTNNAAIGYGQNPALPGTPGGGSGGAIYTDGNDYSVFVASSLIQNNSAREGGGGLFYVSNNKTGTLTVKNSTLLDNPSAVFWTRAYPGIYFNGSRHDLIVINSTLG
jgi:polymorphic membrane protein